jgi:glutaminase
MWKKIVLVKDFEIRFYGKSCAVKHSAEELMCMFTFIERGSQIFIAQEQLPGSIVWKYVSVRMGLLGFGVVSSKYNYTSENKAHSIH